MTATITIEEARKALEAAGEKAHRAWKKRDRALCAYNDRDTYLIHGEEKLSAALDKADDAYQAAEKALQAAQSAYYAALSD